MLHHSTRTPSFPANLQDYAPWVSAHGLVAPYGKCQCGCGQLAPIAKQTHTEKGQKQGEPLRFVRDHYHLRHSLEDAFWQYVTPGEPDACWEWQQGLTKWGYGVVRYLGQKLQAHRVSYELHYGPIPDGLFACHKCDNPPCVNPNHLFLGTNLDNIADRTKKGRSVRGEQAHSAKLQEADVVKIRELHKGGMFARTIAKQYGVNETTIGRIVRYEGWLHVP